MDYGNITTRFSNGVEYILLGIFQAYIPVMQHHRLKSRPDSGSPHDFLQHKSDKNRHHRGWESSKVGIAAIYKHSSATKRDQTGANLPHFYETLDYLTNSPKFWLFLLLIMMRNRLVKLRRVESALKQNNMGGVSP